jgi:hypothetical protein
MPSKKRENIAPIDLSGPYVIVDFVFDRGLLSISVKNIGQQPAFVVRVEFSHRLVGIEGTVDVSGLALFHALEFLPGGKEISTFFDSSASFFRSKQPTAITAQIAYTDSQGRKYSHAIRHNLEIYRHILISGPTSCP